MELGIHFKSSKFNIKIIDKYCDKPWDWEVILKNSLK